jgi:hypothetical protein
MPCFAHTVFGQNMAFVNVTASMYIWTLRLLDTSSNLTVKEPFMYAKPEAASAVLSS